MKNEIKNLIGHKRLFKLISCNESNAVSENECGCIVIQGLLVRYSSEAFISP